MGTAGYEVLHSILDFTKTYEIPFIFSTSNSENVDKTKALALGADDYIIKPFKLNEVVARTERLVGYASAKSFLQVIK